MPVVGGAGGNAAIRVAVDDGCCDAPRIALVAAAANSPVLEYRSSGSLAIPRAMTRSNAAGRSGRASVGRGGGVFRWAFSKAGRPSTGNGRWAVRHSYNTQVNEYTSVRASTSVRPMNRSGAM